MIDYPALTALAEVIRRGSFESAAAALNVTPSAVSQRVKTLEARSGQVLLRRSTPPQPTRAGLRLLSHLDQVRLLEAMLHDIPADGAAPPVIRIAVTADSLASWAMPALVHTPGLVDLVIDDQDHAESWLRDGTVSAAITAQPGPVAGCLSYPLGVMRYIACASPDFVARHFADGVTARTLAAAPALRFNAKDGLQERWVRQVTGQSVALPQHMIPEARAFAQASRLGMGWGMNPQPLVKWALSMEDLVPLIADSPLDVTLHWQVQRIMDAPLQPLTQALRIAARKELRPMTEPAP